MIVSMHTTSPAYMQRAAIVAAVSFVFFLLTLLAFYVRQQIGYFVLSTAFLVVYLLTMISWVIRRRAAVRLHEGGLKYRKFSAAWDDIRSVNAGRSGLEIVTVKNNKVMIPLSISGYESIVRAVRQGLEDQT